ncbi:MAG: HAMP domain-containing sensor histidine kinase [Polyangiaceae bacterium]
MSYDDAFFGKVGHDLRGELATVLAGVHYLLSYETSLAGTGREMLERVNGAGHRLKRLLGEFDNAIWLEPSATRELYPESYRLDGLCAAALERVAHSALARDVTLEVDVATGLERSGSVDALGVALEYVLELAILRSRGGTVRVHGAEEAGRLRLRVRDAGAALAAEKLARLFEPFVEKETLPTGDPGSRRRERLGLGLAIASGVLRAHGGEIRGENASEPEGLLLTLTLDGG